ncbi:MAG: hypothetical protein MJE66_23705 [Proteobacteria bacterium]|nr:hypothetical protein [Pseudomonadota bacterium]
MQNAKARRQPTVAGARLPLGHPADETPGASVGGDGLQSLRGWQEGRMDAIESYCRRDVALLHDLGATAETHGHLRLRTRAGERVRLPAPRKRAEPLEEAREGARACSVPPRRGGRRPTPSSYAVELPPWQIQSGSPSP